LYLPQTKNLPNPIKQSIYRTLERVRIIRAMMTYKGYTASVEVDVEAGILFGRVLDIKDVVTFKAKTVEEVVREFQNSVDDYLAFCDELGEEPDKPFSGKLPFRTTPQHHHKIFLAAKKAGKSINAWMDETLTVAADKVINTY
jgi:predicted HicB family RNase H-like nuclease